jgi:2-amino-4-hydroxy-6-hydroxymethyldihydropteridine diphosphokinase
MERKSGQEFILIGLGANLPGRFGGPRQMLEAALERLGTTDVRILRRSRFWRTRPVPVSDQPWFVNAVAVVDSPLDPAALLARLHAVEDEFGRLRSVRNAARVLDLDLLAYGRLVMSGPQPPLLPHPRLAERAFVLLPLAEVAPGWIHPVTGEGLPAMIAGLPHDQQAVPEA